MLWINKLEQTLFNKITMRTDIVEEMSRRGNTNSNGNWKSTLCECCRDEETCTDTGLDTTEEC